MKKSHFFTFVSHFFTFLRVKDFLTASAAIDGYTYTNGIGLFARITYAQIKNLNVEAKILNPVIKSGTYSDAGISSAVAGLVGVVYGSYKVADGATGLYNCTATIDLDVEGTGGNYRYAGLVGYTNNPCIVQDCTTNGSMKIVLPAGVAANIGGVVGHAVINVIDGTTNNIDIEVTSSAVATTSASTAVKVGGIFPTAGQGVYSSHNGDTLITNPTNTEVALTNNGDITVNVLSTTAGTYTSSTKKTTYSDVYVGGIFANPSAVRVHMEKMLNTGNITVNNSTTNAYVRFFMGGIMGTGGASNITDNKRIGDENRGNITLNGATAGEARIGGLVGDNYAGLQNCVNRGTITINGDTGGCRTGGLVGNNQNNAGAKITSCSNYGAVNINDDATNGDTANARYIGGLAGLVAGPDGVVVKGCHNYGAVTYNSYGAGEVGGIASCISAGNSSAFTTTIQDTTNHADVTVVNFNGTRHRPLGGILGSTRLNSKLINCTNEGVVWQKNVYGNSNATGGIVGTVAATITGIKDANDFDADGNTTETMEFTNTPTLQGCINKGEVKVTVHASGNTTAYSDRWLGGIIGNGAGMLQLINCTNNGNVTYSAAYSHIPYIGGIAGNITSVSLISGCVNTGTITATTTDLHVESGNNGVFYVGGIAGLSKGTLTLTNVKALASKGILNCTNSGAIVATSEGKIQVGGITTDTAGNQTITNAVNNGNITVTYKVNGDKNASNLTEVGGIAAYSTGGTKVTGCTNNGKITVNTAGNTARTGGIHGYISAAVVSTGNTNNGNILVKGSGVHYTGGMMGEVISTSISGCKTFSNLLNTGNITNSGTTGNNAAAGIIGRTGSSTYEGKIALENCINVGQISRSSLSGGIIGYTSAVSANYSFKDTNDYDGDGDTKETIKGWIDVNDYDQDGDTTDLVPGYLSHKTYTVSLKNCIGYGSGVDYALIGSARASYNVFENCFGNTEYLLSYNNQNAQNYVSAGVTDMVHMNGAVVEGNDVSYNPTKCARVILETLDKARVRIDSTGDAKVSGIRFDSYITKDSYNEIKKITGVTLDIGTLIAPTQILAMSEVAGAYDKKAAMDALGGTRYVAIPYDVTAQGGFLSSDGYKLSNKDDLYFFAGALEEIKEENYNVKFTAIGYATITIGDFTFTCYADYDVSNTERARSIAQVATSAFEDRATADTVINGVKYNHIADFNHECYLGQYSPYSNPQLALLKTYSGYVNSGTMPAGFSVNGVSISDYKIVYRHSPIEDKVGSATGKTIYEDLSNVTLGTTNFGDVLLGARYDYDYQTACRVRDLIAGEYGVTLPVVKDTAAAETDYEILVGLTNRSNSKTAAILAQNADEFTFKIDGSKIVICGGSYGSTWHAVDELEELFKTLDGGDYNFKMAGDLDGLYLLKKIACIGDSITRGSQALPVGTTYATSTTGFDAVYGGNASTIYLEQYLSYPANLQRTLWKDAIVYNFGRGASTAGNYNNPDNYYEGNYQWRNCYATSNDPDIAFDLVFMQHGTNDAGQNGGAYTWNTAKKDFFAAAVDSLISKILEGSPNATFVLNNAPHAFDGTVAGGGGRNEANDEAIREVQLYTAKKLAAKYAPLGITILHYDMNKYTSQNLKTAGTTCTLPANPTTNPTTNIDSSAEAAVHGEYYNITNLGPYNEGTHPNYKGYNKIAAGVNAVVQWLLFNGSKPTAYMIDVA